MRHNNIETLRNRLAMRGLSLQTDIAYMRMIKWTRFTYAVSGIQIALATSFAFAPTLWFNAFFAALAVLMPHHFLEYFYNHVLRRWTRTAPLPPNGAPTKFALGSMSVCLLIAATAFETGYEPIGYAIGTMIVFFATVVCLSHICIPAAIYGFITGTKGCATSCTLPQRS